MKIILGFFFVIISAVEIVSHGDEEKFKVCLKNQVNFNDCMQNNTKLAIKKWQKGNEALNIVSMEPMLVDSFVVDETDGNGVAQFYKNIAVTGLVGNTVISDFNVDFNELIIRVKGFSPRVVFASDYRLKGKVHSVPIYGNGKCEIILKNLKTQHTVYAILTEKNGSKHLKIKDWKVILDPEEVESNFTNLYNGNWFLATPAYWIIKHYPLRLFKKLQGPFVKFFSEKLLNISNSALDIVSYNQIIPDA